MVVGLGTGRCGTQTFAKMFDLPHQDANPLEGKSDVSPKHLPNVLEINSKYDVKFVCLKRKRDETIKSFVDNDLMKQDVAELYYDTYYALASTYDSLLDNFAIFSMDELNNPARIENFLDIKSKEIDPITGVCNLFSV